MKFVTKRGLEELEVKAEQDGDDVDIIVTLANGDEKIIAYLSNDGLTLCEIGEVVGIETNGDGYIKHQYDN